jgi:hypothetical protein
MNDIDSFIAQFLEDVEEDCGISIQREFDEFEKILQNDLKGIKIDFYVIWNRSLKIVPSKQFCSYLRKAKKEIKNPVSSKNFPKVNVCICI